MRKSFTPTMELPTSSTTNPNSPTYSKAMKNLSASLDHTVTTFVAGEFTKTANTLFVEVNAGVQAFKVSDGSEYMEIASNNADKYTYDPDLHKAFLMRLKDLLSQEFPVLMAHAAYYLGVDLSASLDTDWAVIKNVFNLPFEQHVLPCSSYCIGSHEVDAVLHLSRIISFLHRPFTGVHHRGLVVVCYSVKLLPFFSTFSRIVQEAAAPTNLYTFLPVLSEHSNNSLTANLSIILKSADVDSAVRACVTSLLSGSGTKSWKPYVILVEEAVLSRVLNRLKYALDATAQKSEMLNQLGKLENYLNSSVLCDGGECIAPACTSNGPFFITNMELSVLTKFPFEDLPISHLFGFRTTKEALALAAHCFNLITSRYDPILHSSKPVNICANLWTSSLSVSWYLATSLVKSGFSNIFINASHQQLLNKMYTSSLEPIRVDFFATKKSVTAGSEGKTSLLKLLPSALKAQLTWSSVSPGDREQQLRAASGTVGLNTASVFERIYKLFVKSVENAVGSLDKTVLAPLTGAHLHLAHEWLLPTGPIVIAVPDRDPASLLLHVCLYALLSGNAVVIICWENGVGNKLEDIHSLRRSLPNKDLVSVHTCAPNYALSDLLDVLSEIHHPGIVLPPLLLKGIGYDSESEGAMANSDVFQPWRSFFNRSARLFLSIGDSIFVD